MKTSLLHSTSPSALLAIQLQRMTFEMEHVYYGYDQQVSGILWGGQSIIYFKAVESIYELRIVSCIFLLFGLSSSNDKLDSAPEMVDEASHTSALRQHALLALENSLRYHSMNVCLFVLGFASWLCCSNQ